MNKQHTNESDLTAYAYPEVVCHGNQKNVTRVTETAGQRILRGMADRMIATGKLSFEQYRNLQNQAG